MNLVEIGMRIKSQRRSLGISQEKLDEMIDVTAHYIYEIERGLKAMSVDTLVNMSTALDISTDYILFGHQKDDTISLSEQLNKMDEEQRTRAESAFKALLPYIK